GSVAQYSDGIYTSSTVEAGKTPLFVDRIEVLRGPQGTLYGRNSIGGAINIISKRPTEDPYAEIRGQIQNYDHTILEGAASGPTMIPGVQFRVAAGWEKQTEGWLKNNVPGQPDEGNIIDQKIWEGQLKFHFNDKFDGWMKLSGIDWHNQGGGPGSRNTYTHVNFTDGTNAPNVVVNGTTVVLPSFLKNSAANPITFPTYENGNAAIAMNPGYGCLPTAVTGVTNVVTAGGLSVARACHQTAQDDPRHFTGDVPYQVKLTGTTIFASEWTYHFDKVDLKYIAGGTHYHYHLGGPTPVEQAPITQFQLPFVATVTGTPGVVVPGALGAAGTVNPRYWFSYEEKENWFSNELNLSSTSDGPFQWIVGAYYYKENYTQPVSTTLLDQKGVVTNGPFLTQSVCVQLGSCPALAGNNRIYDDRPELEIVSKAAFGQIDWAFAEHWKTTLGIRYTQDHKFGLESLRLLTFNNSLGAPERFTNFIGDLTQLPTVVSYGTPGSFAPGVSSTTVVDPATGFATRHYDNKWEATTGTAGLQWDPEPGTMAYLRYSRGYKAGGFRIGIDTVLGALPNTNPEHADAFELGLKKDFGRTFQMNVALFHYKYTDAQIPITVASTAGGLAQAQSIFFNIPESVTQGAEFETTWQPIDHLQILFNYSYLDAHIEKATGVVDPADPAALDPAAKPVISQAACIAAVGTANACSADIYTTGLANGGFQRGQNLSGSNLPNAPKNKVSLNVNYTWVMSAGSLTGSASYVWRDKQYGSIFNRSYYQSPSYDQVDLRATWKSDDKKYSIIGFVRNVGNTVGYEGGAGAGRRNGTIPAYVAGTIPTGGTATTAIPIIQGIASSYTITPPRTFGVELQYRFF
ncbi:MAG: TonB-dependent receptor, partial [Phenylobacterium sp.]